MFIQPLTEGFYFTLADVAKAEKHYNAKYMGYWAIKDQQGNWTETPVEVFYQANPDKSKGHSHYFGLYRNSFGDTFILNAESAFSKPIIGVLTEDGEVLVSRYRHDYVCKGIHFIDGGRDYLRWDKGSQFVEITVDNGEFIFKEVSND